MPVSIECLLDVYEESDRVVPPAHVVDDVLDKSMQLVIAAVPSPEAELAVREKIVVICELLLSLKTYSLSDLAERSK